MDNTALYKLGYGLYVLTSRDGDKDNGCIVNTVLQVTSGQPFSGVIGVNKQNYTHDMIMDSRKFNISVLTEETPFEVFKRFGFQSGATVDKFAGYTDINRSDNGLLYLTKNVNAMLSFDVTDTFDFGSHTLFKAEINDGEVLGKEESATYAYYQARIKPKPQDTKKDGYRCTICGYIYEDGVLPADFICPICKHGAGDFVKL